ncbi:polysaccharide deacetylase family protein [Joostella atrarenae]|uniref:Polysaccharide deacetylase family protein n=1 Tax=Joostella atrarenae TaxID=679257 RepID=A0ABS9IYV5_9FLAO|nr:polysaccharide deacetylase family protein [Joostella atrarenae]MCF8713358.1 polysaccharide deacetylase family protein [Joostella atrarenae]
MKPYLIKTPRAVKLIFKKLTWDIKTEKKEVFLTFDDGPTPDVTAFVLEQLQKYNAKATFFCIGKNASLYPEILKAILAEGHSIGNHTNNHYNASKHKLAAYLENVTLAKNTIEEHINFSTKLFRPPYGRISSKASKAIRRKGYTIIMWDVLSADFDTSISVEKCINNVIKNVTSGSIVVFHDSKKSYPILKKALPVILEKLQTEGYSFSAI